MKIVKTTTIHTLENGEEIQFGNRQLIKHFHNKPPYSGRYYSRSASIYKYDNGYYRIYVNDARINFYDKVYVDLNEAKREVENFLNAGKKSYV